MMQNLFPLAVCALIGYLLGCSNMALYVSKLKGVDLRQTGSKNLGASNTYLTFGMGWAALVFLHDAGKAALAIYLSHRLFPAVPAVGHVAGAAAVLGHMFPFYLRFRGGKGFAAYLGTILMLNWRFGLIMLVVVAGITLITNYIVIGTVTTVTVYPIFTAIVTRSLTAVAVLSLASIVILWKHRENYVRIANGTEAGLFKKT